MADDLTVGRMEFGPGGSPSVTGDLRDGTIIAASSWRDIATAPRDGTLILAWDGVNQSIVEFDDGFRGGRWFCIAGGEVVWDSPGDRSCLVEVSTPTHWRPLPPAPEPPR